MVVYTKGGRAAANSLEDLISLPIAGQREAAQRSECSQIGYPQLVLAGAPTRILSPVLRRIR
jgi:hypothetical protein